MDSYCDIIKRPSGGSINEQQRFSMGCRAVSAATTAFDSAKLVTPNRWG